jgi:hypothetical protein
MKEVIRTFQSFARIPLTGQLDSRTIEKMNMPRCGNKEDIQVHTNSELRTTPETMVPKWNRTKLTYCIKNLPTSGLDADIVQSTVKRAFETWKVHTNLKFTENCDVSKHNNDRCNSSTTSCLNLDRKHF